MSNTISGKIVDINHRQIIEGTIEISNGVITAIVPHHVSEDRYILPGFIDSHIHIESSMLTPSNFSAEALKHGTIAVVTDPHEIGNVCGMQGINFMIENAAEADMKIFFTVPSCVPATPFETSGAILGVEEVKIMLQQKEFVALSEMMNYPGVIYNDPEVIGKIEAAKEVGKPIDGHCPLIPSNQLEKYCAAGITTDHECTNTAEALEKAALGMSILIREGSSAKSLDDLMPLIKQIPDKVMFCRDDYKPVDLKKGHINLMVSTAIKAGYDLFDVLRAASLNPVNHFNLPVGLLQVGDPADFIITKDLKEFIPEEVWVNGKAVDIHGFKGKTSYNNNINNFKAQPITELDLAINVESGKEVRVIGVEDKSLITQSLVYPYQPESFEHEDIMKIVVYNRYNPEAKPAIGLIKGMGIKNGALASTIAHDSHNIVAVGTCDSLLVKAINALIEQRGGIVVCDKNEKVTLPLPVAGLISLLDIDSLVEGFKVVEEKIKALGTPLFSPLMTLAFTSLPVIPDLKMTDKGLFDVQLFKHVSLSI